MSSKTIVITLAISLASSMLAGCASDDSATTYSQGQMRQMQTVQLGTVISVQQVKTKGEDNGLLTLGGAALGGIAGSTMGGGNRGSAVGTIVGALDQIRIAADEASLPATPEYKTAEPGAPFVPIIMLPGEFTVLRTFSRDDVRGLCASEESRGLGLLICFAPACRPANSQQGQTVSAVSQ